jgi:hypothetical protein
MNVLDERPPVPETAPKTDLMRSLGRLMRGLSALFWGLPLALVVCVQTATTSWLKGLGPAGLIAPVAVTSLLCVGLWLMSDFQRQERVWLQALERSKLLGLLNLGLAPFLHWHQRQPEVPFFLHITLLMALSGLLFLFSLNQTLRRLAAMLPDETLRVETRVFTSLNGLLLALLPALVALQLALVQMAGLPRLLRALLQVMELANPWVLLFLLLLPLAITMSLIWKIKEAILASVFSPPE